MAIKTHMLTLGIVQTNCYIVGDTDTQQAVIFDAPDSAPKILAVLKAESWTLTDILLTHSHFDHILAVGDLKAATGAQVRLHRDDLEQYRMLPEHMQIFTGHTAPEPPKPDLLVEEGDTITVGSMVFTVLFTPGHSSGHVSYILESERVVFSGDCLFFGSIGRTDLPGGDYKMLMRSITEKLLPLGDEYTVAAGHMQTTTIGRERLSNPFIFDWMNESAENA